MANIVAMIQAVKEFNGQAEARLSVQQWAILESENL